MKQRHRIYYSERSVCRRHLIDPRHGLFVILEGVEGHLLAGWKLHLFGVKGQALGRLKIYEWVASVDSMAADFAARVKVATGWRIE
jgi:hypothetical protein